MVTPFKTAEEPKPRATDSAIVSLAAPTSFVTARVTTRTYSARLEPFQIAPMDATTRLLECTLNMDSQQVVGEAVIAWEDVLVALSTMMRRLFTVSLRILLIVITTISLTPQIRTSIGSALREEGRQTTIDSVTMCSTLQLRTTSSLSTSMMCLTPMPATSLALTDPFHTTGGTTRLLLTRRLTSTLT